MWGESGFIPLEDHTVWKALLNKSKIKKNTINVDGEWLLNMKMSKKVNKDENVRNNTVKDKCNRRFI